MVEQIDLSKGIFPPESAMLMRGLRELTGALRYANSIAVFWSREVIVLSSSVLIKAGFNVQTVYVAKCFMGIG